ncbi:leucine-rich repeat-containing protein 24-like [Chelonus insularis]|uniref:leucine-rich repeat-containing protein 24-like n=1 Tax=Chelonus insularis TaxID=460826 RepID=UPI00158AD28A|nr:leucine-rich repeat-containing protein 24-like [Chelonus insularis]
MRFNVRWWLSIALLAETMTTMVTSCPSICSCKWKGGKEWVECANRGLTRLPQGAREETQVLDLTGNHLVKLPSDCFHSLGLTNLQKLYLGKSNISEIASSAFVGLSGLVDLDLNGNQIQEVPSDTFTSYTGLMRLILNKNPIHRIKKDAFKPLSQLTTLEISECQVESIDQHAFNGLQSLEWLRLDGNQLTYVPEMTLPLGGNLHGLTLHNNPWLCDCRLRAMQAWLKESAPAAPQESEPVCQAPSRLQDKQIKQVRVDDLACLPEVKVDEQLEIDENANTTLKCDVYAVPMATVNWWINGEKCESQNENDSFTASSISYVRYFCKQRGQHNVTSILYIYGADKSNEGTFTCIAENTAGSTEANLSLRVRLLERSTVEPAFDNPGTGYVAAVAAGALVGTLLALSCVIGSVIFCTKRRRDQKRNSKTLASQSKVVSPVVKDTETLSGKTDSGNLNFDHQQQVMCTRREVVRTSSLDRRETVDAYRNPVSKYLTEPDLINEVYPTTNPPETTAESYNLYQHQLTESRQVLDYGETRYSLQPTIDSRAGLSQLSYLDQDGYPLNFGLPKIPYNANCTLPRLRQRPTEGSAATPVARFTREAEFLARSSVYESTLLSRPDTRYTVDGYPYPISHQPITSPVRQPLQIPPVISPLSPGIALPPEVPFIPSPPAAYRGESTPLSPRSLMSKTAREAAAAVAARAEGARPPDHPESPDEGYVGDALDV